MTGRRLLAVSYWFPPDGGAGTQRIAKACKFLPGLGWTPVVIAGAAGPDAHAPHEDHSLLDDVRGTEVVRVSGGPRGRGMPLARRLRFCLGMDEWADRIIPVARSLATNGVFDAVLTSLSPFSAWRLGRALQKNGLPWVLDLRDPWALDGWRSWRTPVHLWWDLGQMKKALKLADAVVANTPEAAAEYARLGVGPDRLCVIPNGYDEADYGEGASREREQGARFSLVHVGTLHSASVVPGFTRNGWRWRSRQIAPLGRSGHYLLQALALLRKRRPDLVRELVVHLHGVVHRSHEELADRLGVRDLLQLHGYTPHQRALQALREADAVFVPLHDVPEGERALVVPAKLYEALASGVAILGALPRGDAADLVRGLEGGVVVPPCDEARLAEALERMVYQGGGGRQPRRRACIAPFSRTNLTGMIAEVLDCTTRGASLRHLVDPWRQAGLQVDGLRSTGGLVSDKE